MRQGSTPPGVVVSVRAGGWRRGGGGVGGKKYPRSGLLLSHSNQMMSSGSERREIDDKQFHGLARKSTAFFASNLELFGFHDGATALKTSTKEVVAFSSLSKT